MSEGRALLSAEGVGVSSSSFRIRNASPRRAGCRARLQRQGGLRASFQRTASGEATPLRRALSAGEPPRENKVVAKPWGRTIAADGIGSSRRLARRSAASFTEPASKTSMLQRVFHIVAFVQTFCVWFWHFTPAASYLPGASLFGFFFRYLTFCTFTLQNAYFACAVASDATPTRSGLRRWAGVLAGMAFIMSNVVTVMYYGVMQQFPEPIEGAALDRPPYLNLSVHLFNCLIGWADLFITNNMNLSGFVLKSTYVYGIVYTAWMQFIKGYTGKYPYPFLDKLPFPVGPIAVIAIATVAIGVICLVGAKIRKLVKK
eukprot:CAMPEP_0197485978 /NCGR_PEP_ID=MMETSP1311-20131121/893_1 /TAXON_ID=464262 /ORGANISM="Genus nov. species nov., Strain RCC856" /LENGTH=315 /DNA_ID=CAMNT_0043028817 /DNA_START=73 /DNA_END=1020 /DNA_ORIENTATION=-